MFGCPLKDEDEESAEKRSRLEPIPDIGQAEAEADLRRAVVRLSAHVGYHTAKVCEGLWCAVLRLSAHVGYHTAKVCDGWPTAYLSQADCSRALRYRS